MGRVKDSVWANSMKGDQAFRNLWRDLNLLYLSFSKGIKDSTSLTQPVNVGGLSDFQLRRISLRAMREENAIKLA